MGSAKRMAARSEAAAKRSGGKRATTLASSASDGSWLKWMWSLRRKDPEGDAGWGKADKVG